MKKILVLVAIVLGSVAANAQSWQYTDALSTTRWLAGMVALDDNTALMVGGYDGSSQVLASCEIYSPATGTWSATGSLNVARAYPTLIKLSNGHILSMCGSSYIDGSPVNTVEEYDPSTGSWSVAGHLNVGRLVPSATLLNNGKILVAGGYIGGAITDQCEIYDPATNTSSATGALIQNRYEHQSVLMADGNVLVTGGRDGGAYSNYFNECEVYTVSTGTWTVINPMFQGRMEAIITRFSDGTILSAAGRNSPISSAPGSEVLDPSTMTWSSTSAVKEPVCWMGNILFPDDRFMITGGIIAGSWVDRYGLDNITTPKCEWYDHALQQWYYAPELNQSRSRHNSVYLHQTSNTELPTDFLLVAGGQVGQADIDANGNVSNFHTTFTNTAEILDVTPSALKTYMASPQNAAVRTVAANDNSFKVYYMPDGTLKVEYRCTTSEQASIEIMTITGSVVRKITDNSSSVGLRSTVLQTTGLSDGIYLLHLTSANDQRIFKFVVSK